MDALGAVAVKPKNGFEPFVTSEKSLQFTLRDFWSWAQSDLLNNTLRGVLSEFIVGQALQLVHSTRIDWDSFDLLTPEGLRIEVKSSAFLQSWHQKALSKISFDIAPKKGWDRENNCYTKVVERQSDVYVFCLLDHKEKHSVNPLDLDQWLFYVLPTVRLNEQRRRQKTITLGSLLQLHPQECRYGSLKETILSILNNR
ncbi:MAG: hypothetical protein ACO1OQ_02060 [Rufibacter sp.]